MSNVLHFPNKNDYNKSRRTGYKTHDCYAMRMSYRRCPHLLQLLLSELYVARGEQHGGPMDVILVKTTVPSIGSLSSRGAPLIF